MKSGLPFVISDTLTRPANANQYTAKDVVGETVARLFRFKFPVTFHDIGFWVLNPVLVSSNPAATSGSFKLLLFRLPVTAAADHAVFAPVAGETFDYLGFIAFDTPIKTSTKTFYSPAAFSPLWGNLKTEYDSIWGVLLDDSTYTPLSGETFMIILNGQWDQ